MKRFTKHGATLAMAGLLSTLGPVAGAQTIFNFPRTQYDAKVHHSSECQPVFAVDQFGQFLSGWVYYEHSLENRNRPEQVTQVVCPIVRENTTNTNGTVSVEIFVTNVAGQHLSCQLYSYDMYDTLIAGSVPKSTTAGGKQPLTVEVNSSAAKGHYSLRCMLPSGAKLHAYEVREVAE